jgi:hypothetical protein
VSVITRIDQRSGAVHQAWLGRIAQLHVDVFVGQIFGHDCVHHFGSGVSDDVVVYVVIVQAERRPSRVFACR